MLKKLAVYALLSLYTSIGFAVEEVKPAASAKDPYETFNRHAFALNDRLDRAILKPIAKSYQFVMPKVGQKGVHNFYSNLRLIPSFLNDLLQANILQAASDGWRFLINSTIGIGGFLDVATYMDLPAHTNDVGLTFAKWGYENSNYLVIPFWGPSTVRDAIGLIPYYYITVYPYVYDYASNKAWYWGLLAFDIIDMRSQLLDLDTVAKEAAIDPYAFQRNAYLQHRASLIGGSAAYSFRFVGFFSKYAGQPLESRFGFCFGF